MRRPVLVGAVGNGARGQFESRHVDEPHKILPGGQLHGESNLAIGPWVGVLPPSGFTGRVGVNGSFFTHVKKTLRSDGLQYAATRFVIVSPQCD